MDRLRTSAHYFAFAFDEAAARRALAEAVKGKADRLRVRLLLSEGGAVSVTTTPLPPAKADAVMRFVLSPTRLNSADIFLFHKTTRRELYDREWQHYSESAGADEVIYLNERGELAEGSRTTIFLEKDGQLLTPALSSGLLAGTLRADLLASGRAHEKRCSRSTISRPPTLSIWGTRCAVSCARSGSIVKARREPNSKKQI